MVRWIKLGKGIEKMRGWLPNVLLSDVMVPKYNYD